MKRAVDGLSNREFDVLVVGGGIVGACVARDAALRGLDVALIDRADFGGGASANCLKIVHGGLRYLQHLDVRRMRTSIRERTAWLRIAPHLVEPMPFVLPIYGRGVERRSVYRVALAINDALSWDRNDGLPRERWLPRGRLLAREECVALVPQLDSPALRGGAVVYDAQMYSPERLVLEVVLDACAAGAIAANHVECVAPLYRGGRLAGVRVRDRLDGRRHDVRARVVVLAAGAAAPGLVALLLGRDVPLPPFSLAMNLVAPALGPRVGFAVPSPGGRKLFIAPWRGRTLVGTAHYTYDGDPWAPHAERYVERFLDEVNRSIPAWGLTRGDIALVHRGRVPLEPRGAGGRRGRRAVRAAGTAYAARAAGARGGAPGDVAVEPVLLRHHWIVDHTADGAPGLLTVVAEKFTTARRIAEEVVDRVFRKLGRPSPPCVTAEVPLPGAPPSPYALLEDAARRYSGLDPELRDALVRTYGRRYVHVVGAPAGELDREALLRREFAFAMRNEMACGAEDLLARRTHLGARGLHDPVAERIARELTSVRASDAAAVPASGAA